MRTFVTSLTHLRLVDRLLSLVPVTSLSVAAALRLPLGFFSSASLGLRLRLARVAVRNTGLHSNAEVSSEAKPVDVSKVWRQHVTNRLLHEFTMSRLPHEVRCYFCREAPGAGWIVHLPASSAVVMLNSSSFVKPLCTSETAACLTAIREASTSLIGSSEDNVETAARNSLSTHHATEWHVPSLTMERCYSCDQLFPVVPV